jgi:DNA-binding PucR family transcriptional regulator
MAQRIVSGIVGQFVALLVPQNEFDDHAMHRFTDQLLSEATRLSGGRCVMLEIPDCAAPADYASAWRRALRLIDWAASNKRYGRLSLADAGPFGILSEMLDYALVDGYCRAVLSNVRQHDKTQAAVLMPTLQSLVQHGGRPQPVADELNVHISTIRYRMQKLRDSFDIDVRDAEARFRIEMALRLSRLLPEPSETG